MRITTSEATGSNATIEVPCRLVSLGYKGINQHAGYQWARCDSLGHRHGPFKRKVNWSARHVGKWKPAD